MNTQIAATLLGIVLQVGGAAYLVWQARSTSSKLATYKTTGITWDNHALAIGDLAHELHGQFKLQARGFVALLLGSGLQFYGAWPAC
jgi:hypothetical protein